MTPFFSPDWWIGNEQLFKAGLDSFVLVAYASSGACLSELYFRFRRFTLLVQIEKVFAKNLNRKKSLFTCGSVHNFA